jgi:hypothetical protein
MCELFVSVTDEIQLPSVILKVALTKCGFSIMYKYYFFTMFKLFFGNDVTHCFGLCSGFNGLG